MCYVVEYAVRNSNGDRALAREYLEIFFKSREAAQEYAEWLRSKEGIFAGSIQIIHSDFNGYGIEEYCYA